MENQDEEADTGAREQQTDAMNEAKVDARNRLEEEVFSFRTAKDGRVMFYWHGKHVKTIAGAEAQKFLRRIAGLEGKDAQLVMAKATGHFRHGNERRASRR